MMYASLLSPRTAGMAAPVSPWVGSVTILERNGTTKFRVNVTDESAADSQLLQSVTSSGGVTVSAFGRDKADLEDVFLKLVEGDKAP